MNRMTNGKNTTYIGYSFEREESWSVRNSRNASPITDLHKIEARFRFFLSCHSPTLARFPPQHNLPDIPFLYTVT